MKMKKSNDPWLEGQDQITFPIPGWLLFLVKAPFRLLLGLLGAARAMNSAPGEEEQEAKRFVGDSQYYLDVDIYGESQAMYRATHNIK